MILGKVNIRMGITALDMIFIFILFGSTVEGSQLKSCNTISINCTHYQLIVINSVNTTSNLFQSILEKCNAHLKCQVNNPDYECVHILYWCRLNLPMLEIKNSSSTDLNNTGPLLGITSKGYVQGNHQDAQNINCNVTTALSRDDIICRVNEFVSSSSTSELCLSVGSEISCVRSGTVNAQLGPFAVADGYYSLSIIPTYTSRTTPKVRFWIDIKVTGNNTHHLTCQSYPVKITSSKIPAVPFVVGTSLGLTIIITSLIAGFVCLRKAQSKRKAQEQSEEQPEEDQDEPSEVQRISNGTDEVATLSRQPITVNIHYNLVPHDQVERQLVDHVSYEVHSDTIPGLGADLPQVTEMIKQCIESETLRRIKDKEVPDERKETFENHDYDPASMATMQSAEVSDEMEIMDNPHYDYHIFAKRHNTRVSYYDKTNLPKPQDNTVPDEMEIMDNTYYDPQVLARMQNNDVSRIMKMVENSHHDKKILPKLQHTGVHTNVDNTENAYYDPQVLAQVQNTAVTCEMKMAENPHYDKNILPRAPDISVPGENLLENTGNVSNDPQILAKLKNIAVLCKIKMVENPHYVKQILPDIEVADEMEIIDNPSYDPQIVRLQDTAAPHKMKMVDNPHDDKIMLPKLPDFGIPDDMEIIDNHVYDPVLKKILKNNNKKQTKKHTTDD